MFIYFYKKVIEVLEYHFMLYNKVLRVLQKKIQKFKVLVYYLTEILFTFSDHI